MEEKTKAVDDSMNHLVHHNLMSGVDEKRKDRNSEVLIKLHQLLAKKILFNELIPTVRNHIASLKEQVESDHKQISGMNPLSLKMPQRLEELRTQILATHALENMLKTQAK